MNMGSTKSVLRTTSAAKQTDPAKLLSLLALATSAAAMPQTTNADIIFTDLSSSSVTVGYSGVAEFDFTLPGTAQLAITRRGGSIKNTTSKGAVISNYYRTVIVGKSGGTAKVHAAMANDNFVVQHAKGDVWQGQSAHSRAFIGNYLRRGTNGVTSGGQYYPRTYSGHEYLAFEFNDSTEGGAIRYGWAEILLTNGKLTDSTGPNVTIYGYAYDDTGAFIAAGATSVPEPSSAAFLALGALIVGAKGLRAWRRKETLTPGL
jgi:hypothetical protein